MLYKFPWRVALSFIVNFSRRVLDFLRQYSGCMSLLISWGLPLLAFVVRILFLVTSLNFGEILFSGFYLLLFISKTSLFSFQLDFFSHTTCFLRCDAIICTRFLKVIKLTNFRCTFSRCLLSMHFMVYHKVLSSLELLFCACLNDFLEFSQQPGRLPVSRSCFHYNFVVSYTCSADRLLRYDNMLTCVQFFPHVLFYLLASILF